MQNQEINKQFYNDCVWPNALVHAVSYGTFFCIAAKMFPLLTVQWHQCDSEIWPLLHWWLATKIHLGQLCMSNMSYTHSWFITKTWEQHLETALMRTATNWKPMFYSAWLVSWLTVKHGDWNGLFLLDGLCVGETSVANVVTPGVFWEDVWKVQVSVQSLGHSLVQRQPLEVCEGRDIVNELINSMNILD